MLFFLVNSLCWGLHLNLSPWAVGAAVDFCFPSGYVRHLPISSHAFLMGLMRFLPIVSSVLQHSYFTEWVREERFDLSVFWHETACWTLCIQSDVFCFESSAWGERTKLDALQKRMSLLIYNILYILCNILDSSSFEVNVLYNSQS